MDKILVCAPNFSEYKNMDVVEKILDAFRGKENVVLASWQGDEVNNRFSPSVLGEPDAVRDAMLDAMGIACELIDMSKHQGEHPRMGATDVVPFTPIKGLSVEDCAKTAMEFGQMAGERFGVPIYMYEACAAAPHRTKLADVRKGQYEGFFEKIKDPLWQPDFGPAEMNVKSGVTGVCARGIMVPLNVNLNTEDVTIAKEIAKKIRYSSGGFRNVMAIGMAIPEKHMVQVSMDLTDYKKTSVHTVLESLRAMAASYGVTIRNVETGVIPMEVLVNIAKDYMKLDYLDGTPFSAEKVFESYLI